MSISAMGSDVSSLEESSISAPIWVSTSSMPALVGLIPTPRIVRAESGTISAAAMKYAAEDISPGTPILIPCRSSPGCSTAAAAPWASCSSCISAPKAESILSVWSRDSAGSLTTVSPSA